MNEGPNADNINDPVLLRFHRRATGVLAGLFALAAVGAGAITYDNYSTYQEQDSLRGDIIYIQKENCADLSGNDTPEKVEGCAELSSYYYLDSHKNDALLFGTFTLLLTFASGMMGHEFHKAHTKLARMENGRSGAPRPPGPEA